MRLSHDLSHDSWHRIENRHRDIYEYNLQDVSQSITKAEIENEILLKKKLYSRRAEKLRASIGNDFHSPAVLDDSSTIVYIHGSIDKCEGFEGSSLYITLQLMLPEGTIEPPIVDLPR
jgi:hypothetical protein